MFTAVIIGFPAILITTLINVSVYDCVEGTVWVESKRGAVHTIYLTHTGLQCCQVEITYNHTPVE
jgi:hypothetical protein